MRLRASALLEKVPLSGLLLTLIVFLFAVSLWSLYSVRPLESSLWWGDETWRTLQARGLLAYAKPIFPEAVGATLSQNIGLVAGANWLSLLIYGIPYWLAAGDPVIVGRIVTICVSLLTLISVYRLGRTLGLSQTLALASVLLLQTNFFFVIGSHSARQDMITALGITLLFTLLLTWREISLQRAFVIGLALGCLFLLYIHALTLCVLPTLSLLIWRGVNTKLWLCLLLGLLASAVVIALPFYIMTGGLSLYGPMHDSNQFKGVTDSLPLLHLLSPNAHRLNLTARVVLWWQHAPFAFAILLLSATALVVWRKSLRPIEHEFVLITGMLIISSILVQGPAIFYVVHIAPMLILAIAIAISGVRSSATTITGLSLIAVILHLWQIIPQAKAGSELIARETRAVRHLLSQIPVGSSVLGGAATERYIASDPRLHLQTHHFLLFPNGEAGPSARYAVLFNYSQPVRDYFGGTVVDKVIGEFNEEQALQGVSSPEIDTIYLLRK